MLVANVALPNFIWHGVLFLILSPLIVCVEAFVLRRVLHTSSVRSIATAGWANVRSTLAGLPLAWCMAFVGLLPIGVLLLFLPPSYRDPAGQIVAYTTWTGGIPNKYSQIAMAAGNLIILIPYYIYTVRIERRVVERRHPEIEPARVAVAVRAMNRITYAVLASLVVCWLIAAVAAYNDDIVDPLSADSARKTFEGVSAQLGQTEAAAGESPPSRGGD